MRFITNIEDAKKRIINLYPEFKNSEFKGDDSGWCNYAVKVDNKYIFRFCRNIDSYKILEIEEALLSRLSKELPSNIKVPNYIYKDLTDEPFVGYEMIDGKFLSDELYNGFSKEEKDEFINNVKTFLNILHNINYDGIDIPVMNPTLIYKDFYEEIQNKCYKYFDDSLKAKTKELFENFFNDKKLVEYSPKCLHGDFSEDHIIITDDGIGIIDFGDVRIFDPCYDMTFAYDLDKDFFNKIAYDENAEYRIKNFYGKIVPYHQVIYGVDINDEKEINEGIERLRKSLNI